MLIQVYSDSRRIWIINLLLQERKNELVISLLPEERLGHPVVSRLSAPLTFIVPSEGTDSRASGHGGSVVVLWADLAELGSYSLASSSVLLASLEGGEYGDHDTVGLDAMVVVFLVSLGADHGAVAASLSLEELMALCLVGGRRNLFAVSSSVSTFAAGLWLCEVELTGLDGGLGGLG